jgi:homocysteine S-methyltransferase
LNSNAILDALSSRVVLGDGAVGTELYARGIYLNRCFEELNRSNPELVLDVHRSYQQAGAEVLTTNSYGANRSWLRRFGLADRVRELNERAAQLAREVARDVLWVGGSVGPLRSPLEPASEISVDQAYELFRSQIGGLVDGGVDLLVFETFRQPEMLDVAIRAGRELCSLPILASFVAPPLEEDDAEAAVGLSPEQWARRLVRAGADIVGTNCVNGPQGVVRAVERMAAAVDVPVAAMPNAGYPEVVGGRTLYLASPEYMAEYARRFVLAGARLVGGCCGTTPAMIREMASFLRSIEVRRVEAVTVPPESVSRRVEPPPLRERSTLGAWLHDPAPRFAISVELSPPRGTDPTKAIATAARLHEAGIDFVNIPDGPRAVARMNPATLARQIREQVGIEAIVHVCCRDRNTLGLQMDLIGHHADNLRNLLCVTGDPPKMGNHPDASAVFDLDAVGLLKLVRNLNHGLDLGGQGLRGSTAFVAGCGVNPGASNMERELDRLRRKIDAGARFIFSQPVYESALLTELLDRISDLGNVPFLVGILPLDSLANAEFFHHEVPGMQVPREIRERLGRVSNRDEQRAEGVRIAQETLLELRELPGVQGAYLFPPFGRVEGVLDVVAVLGDR